MSQAEPLTIDVFSDVVCPWCFIGKRRLEKAIAMKPGIPVQIRYQPYFLNPWVPREGMTRDEYLTTKFGSPERYTQIAQRVAMAAKQEGLTYNIGSLKNQPNTLDCHRLILWAAGVGKAPQMKQRLMDLYFTEGGDLTSRETLIKAAGDVGLDVEKVRVLLGTDADVDMVTEAADRAKEAGIEGVPFFIFGGVLAVSGAQEPATLAGAIEKAAQEVGTQAAAVQ
ncbi:MAG: DsbA family oxidoreductase [Pseudolabrys sp.]|nr:DsbA family oxidoreductase [Pseudolabrys sp.]